MHYFEENIRRGQLNFSIVFVFVSYEEKDYYRKMSPVRARTQTSQSGGEFTNHKPSRAPSLEDLHCEYKKCLAKSFLLLYMNDFDLHFKFHHVFSWTKSLYCQEPIV